MQKLQTVNAETLLYEPLEKPSFVVDSLIPTGLSLFCGSQKIGKSWLMLKLCLCVSQGIPLWDMPTMEGDVLYLCLEDTFCRIQDRLFRLTDEASGRLHFAVASCKLSDGLIVQLEDYLKEEWAGTATELLAAMGETETIPTVITKWLNEYRTTFLSENRICYQYSRRKDGRQIALARRAGDSGDGGDSDIGIPPVTVIDA